MKSTVHNKRDIININIKGNLVSCVVLDIVKVSDLPVAENSEYSLNTNCTYLNNVLCYPTFTSGSTLPSFPINKYKFYNTNILFYKKT